MIFVGSSGQEDKESTFYIVQPLSKFIRLCMEIDKKVVLLNLGRLHESLHEVFNQQYAYFNGRPTCRGALGSESRQVPVHRDFRCVVVLTTGVVHPRDGPLDEQASIQRRFLSALLSRFEKVVISYDVEIPKRLKDTVGKVKQWLASIQRSVKFHQPNQSVTRARVGAGYVAIPGASSDVVDLLCLKAIAQEHGANDFDGISSFGVTYIRHG